MFDCCLTDGGIFCWFGCGAKDKTQTEKGYFTTTTMHVDAIYVFAWTLRYAALRSVLPIRMCFEGHLVCMAAIMWSIPRRNNPEKHGWRVSFSNWLFADSPDGPGKYNFWVTHTLV